MKTSSDAPILAVTESYRRHPDTQKIEALVLTCIIRVDTCTFLFQNISIIIIYHASLPNQRLVRTPEQAHPMALAKWTKKGNKLDASRRFLDSFCKMKFKIP